MNLNEMAQREGIPANVTIKREDIAGDCILIRATQIEQLHGQARSERGAEVLITQSARKMYGDGPSVVAALSRIKTLVDAGLPLQQPNGKWHHEELADI